MCPNLAIEVALHVGKTRVAALDHLILPGEPECQTEVLQLHQIDMSRRVLTDAIEHLEELLAAPRFAMERDEQRLLRPVALSAPRRREHGFIQARAQHVSRRARDFAGHARRACPLLEPTNLFEHMSSEIAN